MWFRGAPWGSVWFCGAPCGSVGLCGAPWGYWLVSPSRHQKVLSTDQQRASYSGLTQGGPLCSARPSGPCPVLRWVSAPWLAALSLCRPWPRLEQAASLETSHCQADFPFSFPSSCYFSAIPRGKTHSTHRAFPERAWPLSGPVHRGTRLDVQREKARSKVGPGVWPGVRGHASHWCPAPDPKLWRVPWAPGSTFWGICT